MERAWFAPKGTKIADMKTEGVEVTKFFHMEPEPTYPTYQDVWNEVLIRRYNEGIEFTVRDIDDEAFQLFYGMSKPQAELLWRLNEMWAGRDPGTPINWKGL